jgi:hypothetical protein
LGIFGLGLYAGLRYEGAQFAAFKAQVAVAAQVQADKTRDTNAHNAAAAAEIDRATSQEFVYYAGYINDLLARGMRQPGPRPRPVPQAPAGTAIPDGKPIGPTAPGTADVPAPDAQPADPCRDEAGALMLVTQELLNFRAYARETGQYKD